MPPCLGSLFFLFFIVATAPDVKIIVNRLETRYRSARTLQATFLERYIENGRIVRIEAGIAYFRRPGKMRWEYEAPEKNLFLVDGKSAWFYVPADHTVTRSEEHTSELQSHHDLVCRLLLEKKKARCVRV